MKVPRQYRGAIVIVVADEQFEAVGNFVEHETSQVVKTIGDTFETPPMLSWDGRIEGLQDSSMRKLLVNRFEIVFPDGSRPTARLVDMTGRVIGFGLTPF